MIGTKALIVYISVHHGNTERIARALAERLGADLLACPDADPDTILRYDLIGLGSGIYFGRHHGCLLDLVDRLPPSCERRAFLFSTAGYPRLMGRWHKALKEKLVTKGFLIKGEFCCEGFDTYGPLAFIGGINKGRPDANDIVAAEAFAEDLLRES
ncbi:MAG: flavodoxin family protein [Methanomicrobiaceae archaeon]|nr:flavodoxin family protein [Methanomicrobiaceae archaeon]MDD5418974.1 flavodoxin family protein [Methanomicrobiaceae archaeon]